MQYSNSIQKHVHFTQSIALNPARRKKIKKPGPYIIYTIGSKSTTFIKNFFASKKRFSIFAVPNGKKEI